MCVAGNSWWLSQCRRTCKACESGLPPCTHVPEAPVECDASCVNAKTDEACESANTKWNMCKIGGKWWQTQCKRTCQACNDGLPPCPDVVSLVDAEKSSLKGKNVKKHNFLAAH